MSSDRFNLLEKEILRGKTEMVSALSIEERELTSPRHVVSGTWLGLWSTLLGYMQN